MPTEQVLPKHLRDAGYGMAKINFGEYYSLYRNGRWLDDDVDTAKLLEYAEHHYAQRLGKQPVKRKLAKHSQPKTTRAKVTPAAEDLRTVISTAAEAGETPCRPLQLPESDKGEPNPVRPIKPVENPLPLTPSAEEARQRAKAALDRLPEWRLHEDQATIAKPPQKANVAALLGIVAPVRSDAGYGPERVIQVVRTLSAQEPLDSLVDIGFTRPTINRIATIYGHLGEAARDLRPFERREFFGLLYSRLSGKALDIPDARVSKASSLSAGGHYKSKRSA